VHGRGLVYEPFVEDVESLVVVAADGVTRTCSRAENADLFRLVCGGYGLFGVVHSATLRLDRRRKVERVVRLAHASGLAELFADRIEDGYLYGDFQFAIDPRGGDFLRRGVFACYRPVDRSTPIPAGQRQLGARDWRELVWLAHSDKRRAFALYAEHYLASAGQVYWSDLQQLGPYLDGYHAALDRRRGSTAPASEMISELYVPRPALAGFLAAAASELRARRADLIYGTVRLIEEDVETALPWARGRWACVIFNLHTEHTPAALEATAEAFRALIDLARERGGSYYLTYHRWARAAQVAACHPGLAASLERKLAWDPEERFQSEWYRHHRALLAGEAAA
jgi:FAD/FMN-containing dehydrogenase